MDVNNQTLNYLSSLVRLEINENDKAELISDLNKIISFIDTLKEVDTEGLEPLIFINSENPGREDVPIREITREEALKNAPVHDDEYFLVPKVIG